MPHKATFGLSSNLCPNRSDSYLHLTYTWLQCTPHVWLSSLMTLNHHILTGTEAVLLHLNVTALGVRTQDAVEAETETETEIMAVAGEVGEGAMKIMTEKGISHGMMTEGRGRDIAAGDVRKIGKGEEEAQSILIIRGHLLLSQTKISPRHRGDNRRTCTQVGEEKMTETNLRMLASMAAEGEVLTSWKGMYSENALLRFTH